jgi:hypothetical protein
MRVPAPEVMQMPPRDQRQRPTPVHREALYRVATDFDPPDSRAFPLSQLELDMLKHEYDLNIVFARETEAHRSTVMTFVVAAFGAVVYALAALKFDPFYWPIPLIGTLLGAYGAILANIYHERWMFYMMIARGCRLRIAAALPGARIEELRFAAKAAHRKEFKSRRRLYMFWHSLALALSLVATACSAAMLIAHLLLSTRPT